MRALIGIWVLVALLTSARAGFAATTEEELASVRQLIEVELRYKEGVERLEALILGRKLDDREKVEAHRLLAIASIARGEVARAEASFRAVLELDPEFALDAEVSPKLHAVLDRVKEERARSPKILDLQATPAQEGVHFSARVQDPDARVVRVELYTRTNGGGFDEIRMSREGDRLRASIPAPGSEAKLRVEYFLVGRDVEGEAIARVGDAAQPSSVIVERTIERQPLIVAPTTAEVEPAPDWYEHWWVWAIAIGVIGAGTAAIVITQRGSDLPAGTLDDAFVLD